jgi:hypothetical protein
MYKKPPPVPKKPYRGSVTGPSGFAAAAQSLQRLGIVSREFRPYLSTGRSKNMLHLHNIRVFRALMVQLETSLHKNLQESSARCYRDGAASLRFLLERAARTECKLLQS